jgi:predicted nucleotidyltransferase
MQNVPIGINKILQEFINGAFKIFGNKIKKIILYGSYARRRL